VYWSAALSEMNACQQLLPPGLQEVIADMSNAEFFILIATICN
jgi:hypothetical protein